MRIRFLVSPKIIVSLIAGTIAALANPPTAWTLSGDDTQPTRHYDASYDRTTFRSGERSATLRSVNEEPSGLGMLRQSILAGEYLGKRVRLTGWVKTREVSGYASMFFNVYGWEYASTSPNVAASRDEFRLAHDTMKKRRLKGTTNWTKCELVLDIPKDAKNISYGLVLSGTGQAWLDDVSFQVVGPEVPTTDERPKALTLFPPTNLAFEE